jgi:hypothetical protein
VGDESREASAMGEVEKTMKQGVECRVPDRARLFCCEGQTKDHSLSRVVF